MLCCHFSGDNDTVCIDVEDDDPFLETPRYASTKQSEGADENAKDLRNGVQDIRDDLFKDNSDLCVVNDNQWCSRIDDTVRQCHVEGTSMNARRCVRFSIKLENLDRSFGQAYHFFAAGLFMRECRWLREECRQQ